MVLTGVEVASTLGGAIRVLRELIRSWSSMKNHSKELWKAKNNVTTLRTVLYDINITDPTGAKCVGDCVEACDELERLLDRVSNSSASRARAVIERDEIKRLTDRLETNKSTLNLYLSNNSGNAAGAVVGALGAAAADSLLLGPVGAAGIGIYCGAMAIGAWWGEKGISFKSS